MDQFKVESIKAGDGVNFPKKGQKVSVHYVQINGSEFDSSRDCGKLLEFVLGQGQVIKGWDEGVAKLSKGELARLTCPPEYAYGAKGYPPVIPPNSTLVFEVELLGFK